MSMKPRELFQVHADQRWPLVGLAVDQHKTSTGHTMRMDTFWESWCADCPWRVEGFIASGDPFNPNTDSGRFGATVTA